MKISRRIWFYILGPLAETLYDTKTEGEMNHWRKASEEKFKSARSTDGARKPKGRMGCLGIHDGAENSLHSRIKKITPQLLKILKRQA